jgi:hypothetical protein
MAAQDGDDGTAGRGGRPADRRRSGRPVPRRTWRTPLRVVVTVLPVLIGLFLIGQAVVASIGGDIRRWEFALGVVALALTFAGRLVPEE